MWDSDGDLAPVAQRPQLLLNGKLRLEDARIDVVSEWQDTFQPPSKSGIKVSGTWVTDIALKLTAGALTFSSADLLGLLDIDVQKNEIDFGFGKIKGVRWDDAPINIGTVGFDLINRSKYYGVREEFFVSLHQRE